MALALLPAQPPVTSDDAVQSPPLGSPAAAVGA
jgi:hypothetical protein